MADSPSTVCCSYLISWTQLYKHSLCGSIVGRGDWLGRPANIKDEINGVAVYVESSLTVQNPLFFFFLQIVNE